jgi:hypothetical protein
LVTTTDFVVEELPTSEASHDDEISQQIAR